MLPGKPKRLIGSAILEGCDVSMLDLLKDIMVVQCKKTGHTTMTCPYRVAPEHDCNQSNSVSTDGILADAAES